MAAIEITIPESTSTHQAAAVMVFALLGLLPCLPNAVRQCSLSKCVVLVPAGEHFASPQHRPAAARRPAPTSKSPWARVVFQLQLLRQFDSTNNESTLARKKRQRKNDTCPVRPHVHRKSSLLRKSYERPSRLTHS